MYPFVCALGDKFKTALKGASRIPGCNKPRNLPDSSINDMQYNCGTGTITNRTA